MRREVALMPRNLAGTAATDPFLSLLFRSPPLAKTRTLGDLKWPGAARFNPAQPGKLFPTNCPKCPGVKFENESKSTRPSGEHWQQHSTISNLSFSPCYSVSSTTSSIAGASVNLTTHVSTKHCPSCAPPTLPSSPYTLSFLYLYTLASSGGITIWLEVNSGTRKIPYRRPRVILPKRHTIPSGFWPYQPSFVCGCETW